MAHQSNYATVKPNAARPSALIVSLVFALLGCQTLATDVAARITSPTDGSRESLQNAVNTALSVNVTLARDALTDSSVLTVTRNPPRSMENLPAQGRNMDKPMQFRLVLHGTDCILIDLRDDSRYALENTRCIAE